jgi:hypothetical protein
MSDDAHSFYVQTIMVDMVDRWQFYTPENCESSVEETVLHAPKPTYVIPRVCTGDDARVFWTPTNGLLFFPSPPPAQMNRRGAQDIDIGVDPLLSIEGISLLNASIIADHIHKLSQDVGKLTKCDLTYGSPSSTDHTYKATHIHAA